MSHYRVFLGAPSFSEIQNEPGSYSWRIFSSSSSSASASNSNYAPGALSRKSTHRNLELIHEDDAAYAIPSVQSQFPSLRFPFAFHEGASERISRIYKDATFGEDVEEEENIKENLLEDMDTRGIRPFSQAPTEGDREQRDKQETHVYTESGDRKIETGIQAQDTKGSRADEAEESRLEHSVFRGVDQTTMYSWPPSTEGNDALHQDLDMSRSRASRSFSEPSFFVNTQSLSPKQTGLLPVTQQECATQSQPESQSFGPHSSTSSIACFPSFHFNLHSVASLSSLSAQASNYFRTSKGKLSCKVNLLLAVLEVDGSDTIKIKTGTDAGKEVSILKMILGDEEGEVCKLTAWRDVAEEWSGCGNTVGAKMGDIVYVENVMATCEPATSISLSASTHLKSTLIVCYRTMPYMEEDALLRPDLRLGASEPCVRKVASIVSWFERIIDPRN